MKYDPTGGFARLSLMATSVTRGCIVEGMVIQSRVGSYDCVCKVGVFQVACTMLSRGTNSANGFSSCDLPLEGSRVLIYLENRHDAVGWILGVINRASYIASNNQNVKIPSPACYESGDLDPYNDNSAYKLPEEDTEHKIALWANDNRPRDILPGETGIKNENNCGYDITTCAMTITGGDSFIRVDRIDDEIRMRSTNFTKWTINEAIKEFNDAGLISAESREYSYQGEYMGDKDRKQPKYEKPEDLKDKEPRPRVRGWRGFLGNLFSRFIVRAREDKNDDDQGLASMHVSQAGNVMLRAAGGISLERYDSIPVPHRLKEEWDPQGDKEIDVTHEGFKPFNITDPHAMGLIKSSKMAWDQKTAYQRFDELKKDFKVQQESETKELEDEDKDPFGSKEEKFKEFKGRKAGVFVGDDGSVIIRDAWGSEIVMVGGNICINTSGNILMNANRNIVSVAGEGAVTRGVKCADFTSDEGHVHIQAPKTVQIAGGSDKSSGGVLIESLATESRVMAGEKYGDVADIGGVVIRSEKAAVSVSGKKTYMTGLDDIYIVGGDDGATRDGNVIINGKNTIMTASDIAAMVIESSSCLVTRDSVIVGSHTGSVLVAGKSSSIFSGKQVPTTWHDVGDKPDLSKIKDIWKVFQKSNIIAPYNWQNLVKNAVFSFRKSIDARTNTGIEPWRPNGSFSVYEPYWQVMKELGVKTVESEPVTPKPEAVHGSKCWPGVAAFNAGKFVTVTTGAINIESDKAISKKRDSLKDSISVTKKSYSDFQV